MPELPLWIRFKKYWLPQSPLQSGQQMWLHMALLTQFMALVPVKVTSGNSDVQLLCTCSPVFLISVTLCMYFFIIFVIFLPVPLMNFWYPKFSGIWNSLFPNLSGYGVFHCIWNFHMKVLILLYSWNFICVLLCYHCVCAVALVGFSNLPVTW